MRKNLPLLFIIVFHCITGNCATYFARANGNWNALNTWAIGSVGGPIATVLPSSGDDVILLGARTVTVNVNNAICRTLTLNETNSNGGSNGISRITFLANTQLTVVGAIRMPGNGNRTGGINMAAGGLLICSELVVSGNNPGDWIPGSGTVELTGPGTLPPAMGGPPPTNFLFGTFNNLTIKGGPVVLGQNITINGNLNIANPSGQLDVSAANNFSITVLGNWSNSGQFLPRNGVVNFNGTNAQNMSASSFNNISFNNAGVKTASGALTIAGNVEINSNFTAGSFTHTVGGNWINNGSFTHTGSTINFNGTNPQTIGASIFNNISFSGAGVKSASGVLNVQGNVDIGSGSTFDAGGQIHSVRGNWTNNGTFNATNSTIRFNAVSPATQTVGASNFHHIIFDNDGSKTAGGDLAIAGDVTINSNFSAGSFSHTVGGNWSNSGSLITPFTQGTSTITFNGAADQEISSGNNRTTSFHNFIINKPFGRLRLNAPVTITNQASFVNGIIDGTSASVPLLFLDNATINNTAQPSNQSHVNGPVRKNVSSSTIASRGFIFPTGKNGRFVPIEVANASGLGGTLEAEYFPVTAYTLGNRGNAALRQISQCEYWSLRRIGSHNPFVDVTVGWGADNACTGLTYISDPANLVISSFDVSTNTWRTFGGSANSGATAASGKLTWTGVNNINAFTLGTLSLSNSLPVTFAHFTATQREEGIQLAFSNLTEEDVAVYHVERSANGTDFQSIGSLAPKANTNSRTDYTFLDKLPMNGANYYRIRALETTGKVVYSDVVMLRTNGKQNSFVLYPNPARIQSTLSLQMGNLPAGRYQVKVFNHLGQLLRLTQFSHSGGFVSTPLSTQGMAAGTYFIELSGGRQQVQRLVLQ